MAVNSYREDEFMENTDKRKILKRLLSYLFEYKATIVFVLLCMGITVGISLINPLIIEEALDNYVANKNMPGLLKLGVFALVLNVIFVAMVKIRMLVMAKVTNEILLKINREYEELKAKFDYSRQA